MDAQDAAEEHWTGRVLPHPYQPQTWCSMAGGHPQAVLSFCYLAMDAVNTRQHWTPHSWCENAAEHNIHCWKKNQHLLYCFACSGMLMVPSFHCCTHQYGKATRLLKLQPWLFMPYLALACSQVSLRIYGRPERQRCCIEKCHAREKTFYKGSLLRKGVWLAHNLNKLLEIHTKSQVQLQLEHNIGVRSRKKAHKVLLKPQRIESRGLRLRFLLNKSSQGLISTPVRSAWSYIVMLKSVWVTIPAEGS